MKVSKLAVGIGKFIRNGARGFRPTASDLGELVFKAADHIDAYPVLIAGDGIQDWLAACLDKARNDEARPAAIDINFEIDFAENWLMYFHERRGENAKNRRSGLGVLTTQNAEQRLALRGIGTLVDDD